MSKNASRIKAGIQALAGRPYELISGTVVSGSVDTGAWTMSVQLPDGSMHITGVRLNAVTEDDNGLLLVPADGSNVVIGSIDGPGEWVLIRASKIAKASIKIGSVSCNADDTQVSLTNGNVLFNISNSVFKMHTPSEDLFTLLKDLITYVAELTVPTAAGTSGTPLNAADLNNLITRLSNLLTN